MGLLRRAGSVAIAVVFLGAIGTRALMANPATATFLRTGSLDWRVLFGVPLLLVSIGLVALRFRFYTRDDTPDSDSRLSRPVNHWDEERTPDRKPPGEKAADATEPDLLGGQGGARDRSFDIEGEPPDAELSLHLDHLRAELGDDRTVRTELETLEDVATDTATENSIPKRCPQEHCDAAWSERGILGINTGRYEVLEDGETVVCLECEGTTTLDLAES